MVALGAPLLAYTSFGNSYTLSHAKCLAYTSFGIVQNRMEIVYEFQELVHAEHKCLAYTSFRKWHFGRMLSVYEFRKLVYAKNLGRLIVESPSG